MEKDVRIQPDIAEFLIQGICGRKNAEVECHSYFCLHSGCQGKRKQYIFFPFISLSSPYSKNLIA